jgi:PAS domain S-box-containing protein
MAALPSSVVALVWTLSCTAMVAAAVAGWLAFRSRRRARRALTQATEEIASLTTARTLAEEERDRFFALSLDLLCIANADGYFKRLNPAFTRTLGWNLDELLSRPFLEFVHPDDRAATLQEVERQVTAGEQVLQFQNRYLHKDGSWRWLSWTSVPQPGGFMYGSARDVTELRHAEEALRASEESLAVTLHSIGDAVLATDTAGRVVRLNPVAEQLTGWSHADACGRPAADVFRIITEDTRQPADVPIEKVLLTGEVQGLANHTVLIARDGREVSIADSAAPIRDAHGHVSGVVLVFRDVSHERAVQRQTAGLMKDLADIKAALDEHAIVTLTDAQGRMTAVNDKFCAVFQYSRAELLGQNHRIVNSGYHPKDFFADLWRTITHGRVWKGEVRNQARDGRVGWFDTTIVPFLNEQGRPAQFVSIQTDITEQKRAEEEVRQFNTELEALVAARTAEVREAMATLEAQRAQLQAQGDALRASEEQLRREKHFSDTVIESVSGLFYVLDEQGRYVRWNHALQDLIGLTDDEMSSIDGLSTIHEEDRARAGAGMEEAFAHGYAEVEVRILAKDRVRHAMLTGRRLTLEGHTYLVGAGLDITERKAAEAALVESDRFARASLDALSSQVAILDADGVILAANQAWKAFADAEHLAPEHVAEGANYLTACDERSGAPGPNGPQIATGTRAVLAGEMKAFVGEYRWQSNDGLRRFLCRVTRFSGDGPVRVAVAHVDVTAIRESQLAMEQALATLDATEDGVFMFDPETLRFSYVNQGAVRQLGYGRAELLGLTPMDILADLDESNLRHLIDPMLAGEVLTRQLTTRYRHQDGHETPVEINLQFILPPDGGAPRFIAVVRDITERQQAQDAILALNADLERRIAERTVQLESAREAADDANRAKSAFLANMSHEIRTPLNAIAGMVELLDHTPDARERAKMLRVTQESVRALAGIIEDVLDLSKIEAGKIEAVPGPTSLKDTVESVIDLFTNSASAKGLYLRMTYDDRLPACVECDALRLRQILFNLVGNAIKFTAQGGIEVRAARQSESATAVVVRFEVADTGIGISPEAQARLFQPFVQAEVDTTRKFGGSGLGLAISQRLARLLGGSLELDSAEGRGTIVTLTLTLAPTGAAAIPVAGLRPAKSPLTIRKRPRAAADTGKLLIVDDSAINRELLHRQLRILGYDADEAGDGLEAFDMWRVGDYAMVVADCHMPKMDGYELVRRIRAAESQRPDRPHVPIVGYTANAGKDSRDLCLAAGMDDALVKPVALQTLGAALDRWAADPQATDEPPIDWDGLRDVTGGDEQFGREMVQAFVSRQTGDARRLAAMLSEANLNDIASLAHRLKGAARTVAAPALAALFAQIESGARAGERVSIVSARASLEQEVDRLESYVAQEVESYERP